MLIIGYCFEIWSERRLSATGCVSISYTRGFAASTWTATWGPSKVTPKFISRSDPAAQWTGAPKGHAFSAHGTDYLIDVDNAVIDDVEASPAIQRAECTGTVANPDRFEAAVSGGAHSLRSISAGSDTRRSTMTMASRDPREVA